MRYEISEEEKDSLIFYRFTRRLINEAKTVMNSPDWTFATSPFKDTDSLSFRYSLFAFDYLYGLIAPLVLAAIFVLPSVFIDEIISYFRINCQVAFYVPVFIYEIIRQSSFFIMLLFPVGAFAAIFVIPKKIDKRRLGQFELRDDATEMKAEIEAFLQSGATLSEDRRIFLESAVEFLEIAIEKLSKVKFDTGRTL